MASIRTRKNARGQNVYMATIRKGPYLHQPLTKSFTNDKRACEKWAADIESAIERGAMIDHRAVRETTVAALLERYLDEVTPTRKGRKWESNRILAFLREPWAHLKLEDNIAGALTAWRAERLKSIQPATFNRDLNLLRAVFKAARVKWQLKIENPLDDVERCTVVGDAREMTWTDEDLATFTTYLTFDEDKPPTVIRDELCWLLLLAMATGLRRGSMAATELSWIDLPKRCIHYPSSVVKNGERYDCPLSRDAERLLKKLVAHRKGNVKLFNTHCETFTTAYVSVRNELVAQGHTHLAGLTIHDIRHTFTTRLVGKMRGMDRHIAELNIMKLTGRKSVKELARYFNPSAAELAGALLD